MSENNPDKSPGGALAALIGILHPDARGVISAFLVVVAAFALMYTLIYMPTYFKNLASPPNAKEYCWELKEVQGAVFKFNKCTGEAIQLEVKQRPAFSPVQPTPKTP